MSSPIEKLVGPTLLRGKTEVPTAEALAGKKIVMIYFSAHWCPPCRGYTPQLASTYSSSTKLDEVEIIFVSSDQDQAAFDGYHGEMPWLALPYSDRAAKDKLSELYGVRGIPTLVVLNADGTVVTTGGRGKESTWLGGGGGGGGDSSGGGNTGSGCVIL